MSWIRRRSPLWLPFFLGGISLLACTGAGTDAGPGETPPPATSSPSPSVSSSSSSAMLGRHATEGVTPEGALALWLEAAMAAGSPESSRRAEGEAVLSRLTVEFREGDDWRGRASVRTFRDRLQSHPHVFRSYFVGATPENDYQPALPLRLDVVSSSDAGEQGHRVTVRSGGADSPRPVYLKKSRQDGLYYVSSFANTYVDVRRPLDPNREF